MTYYVDGNFARCKHCIYFEEQPVPTIEAEPIKHGRWKGAGMGDYMCSWCGEVVSGNRYHYCPNCGARMDLIGEDPSHPFAESVMGMDEVKE